MAGEDTDDAEFVGRGHGDSAPRRALATFAVSEHHFPRDARGILPWWRDRVATQIDRNLAFLTIVTGDRKHAEAGDGLKQGRASILDQRWF